LELGYLGFTSERTQEQLNVSDTFGFHEPHRVSEAQRKHYLDFALQLAAVGGEPTRRHFREKIQIDNKLGEEGFDPVTVADREAESAIRTEIRRHYPEHGVFGEEEGYQAGNGLTWVIDPIDGTRAFMTGMLHWGVLVALFDGERPIVGVMHQPFTDEFFYGDNASAYYRRGQREQRLHVRRCDRLDDAAMAATGPEFFQQGREREAFRALRGKVKLVRYGGDCYLHGMVAMGQLDLGVEAGLKPYDIQALMPIIIGAGGLVTTWCGENASMGGRVITAGSAQLHGLATDVLMAGS